MTALIWAAAAAEWWLLRRALANRRPWWPEHDGWEPGELAAMTRYIGGNG